MIQLMNDSHLISPVLWIVIPCFNEEEVLPFTAPLFCEQVDTLISKGLISDKSKVCFIDDGSSDKTWKIISSLARDNPGVVGLKLSHNRGHQNALMAGLMESRKYCDAAISIDCDGQDDISAIEKMVVDYNHGSEIVYGVRSDRGSDTAFKRMTAEAFYKMLNSMGAEVVFNHADYRLMGSAALEALSQFGEVNLFLRGIIPQLGFSSTKVEYVRNERAAGKSHYPLKKMLHLAFDGITSLSVKPIRFIAGMGLLFSLVCLIGIIWAIITAASGATVPGWASVVCFLGLLGGVQLVSLGVIGEYIGKIYLEVKKRPRYILEEVVGDLGSTAHTD